MQGKCLQKIVYPVLPLWSEKNEHDPETDNRSDTIMETIKNTSFGGERPLFATHDLRLENVTIHPGESALKECRNIEAVHCEFQGKYPFWHNDGFMVRDCIF